MSVRLAAIAAVAVAGALPLAFGGAAIVEHVSWANAGAAADAAVVRSERRWLRELLSIRQRAYYAVDYEFRTGRGALVRASGTYVQSRNLAAPDGGTRIRVYYRPEDPAFSHVVAETDMLEAVLFVGLGIVIWAAGGCALASATGPRRGS